MNNYIVHLHITHIMHKHVFFSFVLHSQQRGVNFSQIEIGKCPLAVIWMPILNNWRFFYNNLLTTFQKCMPSTICCLSERLWSTRTSNIFNRAHLGKNWSVSDFLITLEGMVCINVLSSATLTCLKYYLN